MKKLTLLVAALPSAAFAHGGHLPVPPEAHGAAHAAPYLAALVVLGAALLGLKAWRDRQ